MSHLTLRVELTINTTWVKSMSMTDLAAQYRLLTWLSPSYPVGAFSYSHGLEFAVETGAVSDMASLICWLNTVLIFGVGRVDRVLFCEAYAAAHAEDVSQLENIVEYGNAFQPTSEFSLESRAQGAAFIRATRSLAFASTRRNRRGHCLPHSRIRFVRGAWHSLEQFAGILSWFYVEFSLSSSAAHSAWADGWSARGRSDGRDS